MESAKLKTADSFRATETQLQSPACDGEDNKLHNAKKFSYTFSTQPLEMDLKKLLTQITGTIDLTSIIEVKLKVVSGQAGLHRLSEYTPNLRILTLDGSCISSLRDLGSSLKALTTLSVARCSMKHLDGISGFPNLEELNARENFVSDPSPCSSVKKLSKLDLSKNQVTDVSYFAFLRSCRKLNELQITENNFSDYKEEIRTLLPQLKILDGEEFEECLQPEEGFIFDSQDLSSEDGSSASFSVEDIELTETQPLGDGVDPEDDGENLSLRISESDLNSTQDGSKILQGEEDDEEEEEKDEENPEKLVFESLPALSDSEVSNNEDKSTAHETPSGKLSSGRVICGNLAVSLRARNPVKSLSLVVPQEIKNDFNFRDEEKNEKDLLVQEQEIKSKERKNCIEEKGTGDYCPV